MDYLEINKEAWNKRTEIHVKSKFYDVESFIKGKNVLNEIEINELGDVKGKSLLHLQCHFGLDTLSWARLGAKVTGVDFSSTAVETAQKLSLKANLEADFICSDIYNFGETSTEKYDIVFTSYGAVCWLPDLEKWAGVISKNLKPGGTFYIAEFHPFYDIFSGYPYFHNPLPVIETEGTYTENDNGEKSEIVCWSHPISEVINSLLKAGIQIVLFNEYSYSPYNCFEGMIEREKGKYYLTHKGEDIPLIYTIKGIKKY